MLRNLGFVWFWKHKDSFCSLNDSLKSLKSVSGFLPRHIWKFLPSLLIILLLKSLYGALVRDEYCEVHLPCICCKVKSKTSPEGSVILLDQNSASVWNFWWNYTPLFDMISFSTFLFGDMASIYIFLWAFMCSSFFLQCFWDLHVSLYFFSMNSLHVSFWKYAREIIFLEHGVFVCR
jgi:hypothetical protein